MSADAPIFFPPPLAGEGEHEVVEGGATGSEQTASPSAPAGHLPRERGRKDGPEIRNFGCRLNFYEGEVIRELTDGQGLGGSVIINTCAVTNEATRQARQTIRKIAREQPEAPIIVTGCGAQIEPERFAALPGVTRVVGNREKLLEETWARGGDGPRIAVGDIMAVSANAPHLIAGFNERARAFIEVQNGCDHRCTFCIIPYGRGNARSLPVDAVTAQVAKLMGAGFKEVVLTGVDLTSWGADLPGRPPLAHLVRRVLDGVPGLARLRLSSIDPAEVGEDLIALFAGEERLMPHVHLSLQAGDDMILKRMKRRHSRAQAIDLAGRLRAARPGIAFGADMIAGFPTETEAMFENSLGIVGEIGVPFLHVFPFSPKAGTPAAKMPQVERAEIKRRAALLREARAGVLAAHLAAHRGREAVLLMERENSGRLPDFTPARLTEDASPGDLVRVRITGHEGEELLAERI